MVFVSQRDLTVDVLRGLAIFVMIGANMAPLFEGSVPFLFRYYGSVAAPLFVLISGMMVALTTETKHHGLKYFLIRGAMIVAVGALVDVLVWNIIPFTTVDVLYLIGISLPLAALSLHLKPKPRWVVMILIFLLTPILQGVLGYTEYPTEFYLWNLELTFVPQHPTNVLNHWIVDGWFPIFPWLGFSVVGVNLEELRRKWGSFARKDFILAGIGILAVGIPAWWVNPGRLMTRAGYVELFYPPTLGFVLTVLGTIAILFYIVDRKPSVFVYNPFRSLGESSLFIYVLHLVVIEYLIRPHFLTQDFKAYLLVYVGLACTIVLVSYGLRVLKTKWKNLICIVRPIILYFPVNHPPSCSSCVCIERSTTRK